MGHQPTYPGGRHAPEIRQVRRRPLSNGVMTATHRDQPAPEPIRPWPAPGSDTTWWHGGQPEPVLTHRPSPARHRERPALPAAPSPEPAAAVVAPAAAGSDRKSTRLNSSHRTISYAVFCLKKKKTTHVSQTCALT